MRFYQTPWLLKELYPSRTWNISSANEIFLTFDDGPTPVVTSWILDVLAAHDAKATFFCLGEKLERHPEIANECMRRGHVLANHTNAHEAGTRTTDEKYFDSIDQCNRMLREIGGKGHALFRPPFGKIRRSQVNQLLQEYQLIMWSHMAYDFDPSLPRDTSLERLRKASPGSIVVFHDSDKAFENLRWLLSRLLPFWSSLGFKFASLPC